MSSNSTAAMPQATSFPSAVSAAVPDRGALIRATDAVRSVSPRVWWASAAAAIGVGGAAAVAAFLRRDESKPQRRRAHRRPRAKVTRRAAA